MINPLNFSAFKMSENIGHIGSRGHDDVLTCLILSDWDSNQQIFTSEDQKPNVCTQNYYIILHLI